jgi:hypothetical protein
MLVVGLVAKPRTNAFFLVSIDAARTVVQSAHAARPARFSLRRRSSAECSMHSGDQIILLPGSPMTHASEEAEHASDAPLAQETRASYRY